MYIAAANEEFDPFAGASLGSECDALKSGINLSQQLQKSGRNTDRKNAAAARWGSFLMNAMTQRVKTRLQA